MIIAEDTYSVAGENWEILSERIENIPECNSGMKNESATIGRSIVFEDTYFCNISVYGSRMRIGVLYIGIDKDRGKLLLEERLGLKLERRPVLERVLTPEEVDRIEKADRMRTSGPLIM